MGFYKLRDHCMDDARIPAREPQARSIYRKHRIAFAKHEYAQVFKDYAATRTLAPLLLACDALALLARLPEQSIDCVMTSPPYWGKREYAHGGIGLESDHRAFVRALAAVFLEVKRVLKREGSLWLNIGDSYANKGLIGIPWRLALELTDAQGWVLRNSVIWNKIKSGMDNSTD